MSKTCLNRISYSQFSDAIHQKGLTRNIPLNVSFELTYRCNLKCRHCYAVPDQTQKELTTKEIYHLLDEITDAGALWLLITGGDPLIRPDFLDIYTYARKNGLIITLFTNGTLLTPAIADHLAEYPPFRVEITLNGITEKTYENISGEAGSLNACLRGIKLLMERKIPLMVKTMAFNLNYHELDKIRQFIESLGMKFVFDPMITARYNGDKTPLLSRLSPKEIISLDRTYDERQKEWRRLWEQYGRDSRSTKNTLFECGAGRGSVDIDPYGVLRICSFARGLGYDLRSGSFQDAWQNYVPTSRNQPRTRTDTKCVTCDAAIFCDQCPAWSFLEYGDYETPVEFLCSVAQQRGQIFT